MPSGRFCFTIQVRTPAGRATPDRVPQPIRGRETMESTDRITRRRYDPPHMTVFGRLEELTLTVNDNMNKNDSVNGTTNLKT